MLNLNKQRDLKITGATVSVSQNGNSVNAPVLDRQTLYASPLITITDNGYTKHYFEEGNRICSSIGSGGFSNIFQHTSPIVSDLKEINSKTNQNAINTYKNNIGVTPYINVTSIYPYIFYHRSTLYKSAPEAVFYYHTDHLGSATLITDDYAQIAEQIVYMPYGEDWIDVRSNGYFGSAYKFNGKEKDDETGYSYYGARYYTDRLSIWLSVDPLADKYPHLSPYAYCSNNPILYVDPDGKEKVISFKAENKNKEQTNADKIAISVAKNYPENNGVIHFWGHGLIDGRTSKNIGVETAKREIFSTEKFGEFLQKNSKVYSENENTGETSILVLHSCRTGEDDGFGQKLSADLNLLVVAPDKDVSAESNALVKSETVLDGGGWAIYYKGEKMDSFSGKSKPLFDKPQEIIKKYEQKYNERHATQEVSD